MFPVSDVIPTRSTPLVTIGLLTASAAGFLYQLQLDARELRVLVETYGIASGSWGWRPALVSLFLHAGWLHAGTNLVYLWLFGPNVENCFGRLWFLLFYLGCGAAAGAVQAMTQSWSAAPMIGASGAVAGVMGAYLVLYPRSRVLTAVLVPSPDLAEIPALFYMAIWFTLQLFSAAGSLGADAADGLTAFWAHLAGFASGLACGAYSRFAGASLRRYWNNS
jgi:membrane associated rhomboid family serine protease